MTLKEIRTNKGLTQEQAALLINVPLRTYKRYETDESYVDSYRYKMFVNELNNKTLVDEEHGLLTIEQIKEIVTPILNKYDIHYCYLFGSYAEGRARENSDVDLMIDSDITGLKYFGLLEELKENLHKNVDLLTLKSLSNNAEMLTEIIRDGVKIYGQHKE